MADLIALGGAESVWDELEEAFEAFPDAYVGAANDAGQCFPGRLTVWVTLHSEKFADWQSQRARNGFNEDYIAVANKGHYDARIDRVDKELWPGSSGLYLCQVAILSLGFERVIVCGMPMTESPHFFRSEDWPDAPNYRRGWVRASKDSRIRGRIKSMSGWTRGLLGHPRDWLAVPA